MRNSLTTLTISVALAACAHAPSQSDTFRLADVDEPPVLVACPELPPTMAGDEMTRRIDVRFGVAADGSVVNVAPARPVQAGWEDITAEAVRQVRSCRYTPARVDGRAVEVAGMATRVSTNRRTLSTRGTP